MDEGKLKAYFGFARRARKLAVGAGSVEACKKVFLIAADPCASENSKKKTEKLATRFGCPLVYIGELSALVCRENCRVAAVLDENLANAISEVVWHTKTVKN